MPKYSQVFLNDEGAARKIAGAVSPSEAGTLVEIGPGRGALTRFLVDAWEGRLILAEIDPEMVKALEARFPGRGVRIVNSDFLELDLRALLPGPTAFIGNLPYQCATPILFKVLASGLMTSAVFMFQKEVALKLCALPGSPDYSYVSAAALAQADLELLLKVPAGAFRPVPEVDSAVVRFRPKASPVFSGPEERERFLRTAKGAFAHRRKTALNSLSLALGLQKSGVEAALAAAGIPAGARAQELGVPELLRISEVLGK